MGKLEKTIEREYKDWVAGEYKGWVLVLKLQDAHQPDVIVLYTGCRCFFIEFKKLGEGPRPAQNAVLEALRRKGHHAYVCDTLQSAQTITRYECGAPIL